VPSLTAVDPALEPNAPIRGDGHAPPASARDKEESAWYCASDVRLLVLDDDPAVCRVIQSSLARNHFTVDAVSDPGQMEAALRREPYHVIILDYCIPGQDSERFLEMVREHQADASIIVVTAFPSIDSALSCLRARTYDYLTKPFQVNLLQRTVTRCLESKGLLRLSEEALRESLGGIIRERRKSLGLTLAQLAKRTGVSLGYLSQIELGKNSASIETLYRISLGLRVRLADLFQSVQLPT
jgi:CheY-like chemotaxis protein/DNA-binding XRE family transcriptional regulator